MKKFINVRLQCLLAVSLVIGIAFAFLVDFYGWNRNFVWAGVAVAAILVLISGLTAKTLRPLFFGILAFALFVVGVMACGFGSIDHYKKSELVTGERYFIEGTVEDVVAREDYVYAIIGDAVANESISLSGKVCATVYNKAGYRCKIGNKVKFLAEITVENSVYEYGEVSYSAVNGYKYRCFVVDGIIVTGSPSAFALVRGRIHDVLFDNLNYETAAVCYGMLVGETNEIEFAAMQNFRYGGIAHIFAVSGLHIGLLYAVLNFLLKKILVNRNAAALVSVAAVFLYAGVCGFTLSSVRAAIMCAVGAFTRLFRLKYDGLNSLATSVVIILLVNPFNLFSLGFQLSVCAVAGINLFSHFFEKMLCKIKTPKPVASTVAVSFAAQAGTLPVMVTGFGYLSGAGLCMNVLIMPVVSAFFYLLFAGTAISAIFPAIAPSVMPVAALPVESLLSVLLSLGFEKSLIRGFGAGIFAPLYYIGMLALTDKINVGFKTRLVMLAAAVAILSAVVMIKTYRPQGGYSVVVASDERSESVIIKSRQGTVLIVNDACDESVQKILSRNYSSKVDAVVVVGDSDTLFGFVNAELRCDIIYASRDLVPLQPFGFATVRYEAEFTVCGVYFRYENPRNLYIEIDGVKIAVVNGGGLEEECDLLVSNTYIFGSDATYKVGYNLAGFGYNNRDFGDLKFTVKEGGLTLNKPVRYIPDIVAS